MAYINGNKILTVVRTLYLSETERDLIARYNLGAYDSVEAINGITTITRQTGYVDLGVFDWQLHGSVAHLFTASLALTNASEPIDNNTIGDIVCAIYNSATWNAVEMANLQIAISIDGSLRIYDESCSTANELIAKINGVILQYKLATSYTEQVIPNQPLNTLDQKGSEWLRNEWEKTLNILDNSLFINNHGIDSSDGSYLYYSGYQATEQFVELKPNTTYSRNNASVYLYDSSKTYTRQITTADLTFTTSSTEVYCRLDKASSDLDTMLTESDHAYPYQAYNGAIVHEKDIAPVLLWENGNPTSAFAGADVSLSKSITNFKYIVICYKQDTSATSANNIKKIKAIVSDVGDLTSIKISSIVEYYSRRFTLKSNGTEITFADGYYNTTQNNGALIPLAIYGTNVL